MIATSLNSIRWKFPTGRESSKLCLVVVVAKACGPVAVLQLDGTYSYPIRRETGITRESRLDIASPKTHLKSDRYEFLEALSQFVHDAE